MTINPKIYDTLKYLAMIGLPGLATFVALVGPDWDLPKVDAITKTITGLGALIGTLTLVNKVAYDRSDAKFDGTISPQVAVQQTDSSLQVDQEAIYGQTKELLLKVVPRKSAPDELDEPMIDLE